jgi:hypothetical protein
MSKKLWLCAPLLSIGLLGCGAMPDKREIVQPDAPVGCNPGACFVDVWVNDCDRGEIITRPEKLEVPDRGVAKNIRWRMRSEGYLFASNGIVIAKPDQEFNEPELIADGTMFKWANRHTKQGEYKYSVNVVKTGLNPKNCTPYDPRIFNE